MLQEYLNASLQAAQYKKLDDDSWFAEIPGLDGVWANGESVERCRNDLVEVLEEWIILHIQDGDPIPAINGFEIRIQHEEVA